MTVCWNWDSLRLEMACRFSSNLVWMSVVMGMMVSRSCLVIDDVMFRETPSSILSVMR